MHDILKPEKCFKNKYKIASGWCDTLDSYILQFEGSSFKLII